MAPQFRRADVERRLVWLIRATKHPLTLTMALDREGLSERWGSTAHMLRSESMGSESSLSSAISWFINSTKFSMATT